MGVEGFHKRRRCAGADKLAVHLRIATVRKARHGPDCRFRDDSGSRVDCP